ncbi:hypothetical protein [Streptomyces sp. NPDC048282]|uniref:hypothetical protein n=1 Tax=Streptomyces sp. NPDC048282 TaxID=3365528 RepID=UPI0037163541
MRPDERIEPQDAVKFAVTASACRSVGWDFTRVGTPDAVLMANVRWLAGYRHPRVHHPDGAGLLDGARRAGDQIAVLPVLPVLFHLLWRRIPTTDLESGPLSADTRVRNGEVREGGGDAVASAPAASG